MSGVGFPGPWLSTRANLSSAVCGLWLLGVGAAPRDPIHRQGCAFTPPGKLIKPRAPPSITQEPLGVGVGEALSFSALRGPGLSGRGFVEGGGGSRPRLGSRRGRGTTGGCLERHHREQSRIHVPAGVTPPCPEPGESKALTLGAPPSHGLDTERRAAPRPPKSLTTHAEGRPPPGAPRGPRGCPGGLPGGSEARAQSWGGEGSQVKWCGLGQRVPVEGGCPAHARPKDVSFHGSIVFLNIPQYSWPTYGQVLASAPTVTPLGFFLEAVGSQMAASAHQDCSLPCSEPSLCTALPEPSLSGSAAPTPHPARFLGGMSRRITWWPKPQHPGPSRNPRVPTGPWNLRSLLRAGERPRSPRRRLPLCTHCDPPHSGRVRGPTGSSPSALVQMITRDLRFVCEEDPQCCPPRLSADTSERPGGLLAHFPGPGVCPRVETQESNGAARLKGGIPVAVRRRPPVLPFPSRAGVGASDVAEAPTLSDSPGPLRNRICPKPAPAAAVFQTRRTAPTPDI